MLRGHFATFFKVSRRASIAQMSPLLRRKSIDILALRERNSILSGKSQPDEEDGSQSVDSADGNSHISEKMYKKMA